MRYRLRTLLILAIGILSGAGVIAADDPKSPAIEAGRPIAETTTILRERTIERNAGAWAETGGNPDIAEVDFKLDEEIVARVFYSKSREVVTSIRLVVMPKGQGRVAHRSFSAGRIDLADDGGYSVRFLPATESKSIPGLKPEFPSSNPRPR